MKKLFTITIFAMTICLSSFAQDKTSFEKGTNVVNAGIGIADYGGGNTWATGGTGGAGSSNNDIFGANSAYFSDGMGTHFITGSTAHPNAAYGDVAINPFLIAPGRRYKDADAFLGGPGTELHLFEQLIGTQTPLVAVLGVAGGLSANPLYTPQAIYQFLAAGFTPTNSFQSLTTGASDGGYLGAMKPLCMGCWIP